MTPDERRAAIETLTPWHGSHDEADGFLRRCIDVECLGDSEIVPTTREEVTVKHRPGCAVAEFFRRLAATAAAPVDVERLAVAIAKVQPKEHRPGYLLPDWYQAQATAIAAQYAALDPAASDEGAR